MRTKYKPWALPYLKEHNDIAYPSFDSSNPFYDNTLCIEIGGGKGDFILSLAKAHPNIHYLMIERVISVAAVALKKIIDEHISNVRIIYENFTNIVGSIKNSAVNIIYLNFSDPWPKKKHEKRRLTARLFLNDYYRILKKKGLIILKTDQVVLYDFSKRNIDIEKFVIIVDNPNYKILDDDDFMSEYEKKFRAQNKNIYRLVIQKL